VTLLNRRSGAPSDLYLDLMKGVLTRLVFDEQVTPLVPKAGWRARIYHTIDRLVLEPAGLVAMRRLPIDIEARREGRDWPPDAETMVGLARLDNLQTLVETVLREDIPGDLLEAGVWRGGSAILMQAILRVFDVSDRRVWVCDSFAGLPKPDPVRYPADRDDTLWQHQYLAVSEEEVQHNFARYGLLDRNIEFVRGLFQDTLPGLPVEQLAILRADGDMYESTMVILENLYSKLSTGGFVVIDDYGAMESCRKAVQDYRQREGITEPIESIDWTGVYWRKTG
jgi:O-methyltransferase